MELTKLQKDPLRKPTGLNRIKYISLGVMLHRPKLSNEELVQRMVDLNACVS